jgi:hypothetical protein
MAALREEMFRASFLKISAADFMAWNLSRDGKDWNPVAMTVVETVNQVHVPGAGTPGAHCQLASQMSLSTGRERCRLLVSHVNPFDLLATPDRIRYSVEGVTRDSVNSLDSCLLQDVYQQVGHFVLSHGLDLQSFDKKLWFHEIAPAAPKITACTVAYSTEVGGAVQTRTGG